MCLATPCKIIKIEDKEATVESNNHLHQVNLDLIRDAKIGDYVLVHGDMAINKVSADDAEKILKLIKEKK